MAITNKNLELKKQREQEATPVIRVKKTKEEHMAEDHKIVRGRFNYNEVPGGTLVFSFRKYKGDAIKHYTLVDGSVYNLPKMIAKHLATTGSYPVHEFQTDAMGKPVVRIGRKKRRYSFESTTFSDDDEVTNANSNLYTVSKL